MLSAEAARPDDGNDEDVHSVPERMQRKGLQTVSEYLTEEELKRRRELWEKRRRYLNGIGTDTKGNTDEQR